MTRILGRCPDGAGCACAWVTSTGALALSADTAASVVPPSRMLRRSSLRSCIGFSVRLLLSRMTPSCALHSTQNGLAFMIVARSIHRLRVREFPLSVQDLGARPIEPHDVVPAFSDR